jgi:hypothetical protein
MLPGTEVDIVMIDGSAYIVKKGNEDCAAVKLEIKNDIELSPTKDETT